MADSKNKNANNNNLFDNSSVRTSSEINARNKAIRQAVNDYEKLDKKQKEVLANYTKQTKAMEEQLKIQKQQYDLDAKALINERERLKVALDNTKNKKEQKKLTEELSKLETYIATGTSKQAKAARFSDAWNKYQGSKSAYDSLKSTGNAPDSALKAAKSTMSSDFTSLADAAAESTIANIGGGIISAISKLGDIVQSGIKDIKNNISSNVTDAVKIRSQYEGKIESRLQGLNGTLFDYSEEMTKVAETLGSNPLISQKEYVNKLYELVNAGVAYNLEERALVATLEDSLLSTFESMDKNLQRLIRVQQADVTYTQLGAEATLTQFLNSMFSDTSYLSDVYDSVSGSIIEAMSTMNTSQSTEFNYAVQKWLGSLYAVGMSESDVSNIASALNQLATGDVSVLGGNMGNLLTLSASNGGLNLASIMTEGLDASSLNDLMKGMVTYLQDIAENTSDNVTAAQWANITGLSRSAFSAMSNLSDTDIASIYGSGVTYSSALSQFNNQMGLVSSRTSIAKQIENLFDNTYFGIGQNIANNTEEYLKYYGAQFVSSLLGDSIVGDVIQALANGSTYLTAFQDLIDNGLSMINGASTLPSFATAATTSRGGISEGLSESATIISNSADTTPVNFSTTTASSLSTVQDGSYLTSRTVSDIYYKLFEAGTSINVKLTAVDDRALEDLEAVHSDKLDDIKDALGSNTSSITNAIGNIRLQ